MAVSISSPAYPLFKSHSSNRLSSISLSNSGLSPSSFLQLPLQLHRLRIGNNGVSPPSRSRVLPVVKAKKQSFSSFDDLLAKSDKPVLVDFYATWCGPCQFMVPVLEEVSAELKDTIMIVKVDTEKYPSIANQYGIQALPTFIIFKDGKPHGRFEGALTAKQLIEVIEESLKVKQ